MVRGGGWLTANQWWNGSANVNWTSGDDAIFGNGGAGGAVTLASGTTVNSITFNSFTGTYTLGTAGQTITLNNGITMNSGAGAATIVSPITLGAAQSWTNNSSSLLTIGTGAVSNAGFLLTIGGTGNTTVSSAIGGAGGLTKSGNGILTLSGANTYTGTTTVNAGTLALSGSGTILNSSGITLSGGNLTLTNTAAETGSGRIHDSNAITSTGGTITYTNTSGANIYTETIGAVTLSSGQLNVVESVSQAGAGSQTLTLGGLSQSGTSAVTFSALTTGLQASGNKNMIVVSGAGTTTAGQIVGPWATVGTSAAAQTDYAVYNANYVTPAAITATTEGSWTGGATGNYTSTSTTNTLTGSRTMNSWRYNAAAGALTLGANNFDTNGILNGGSGLLTISGTGAVRQQGTSAANLYVTTGSNAITISAPIQDNTGALTLVKSGTGGTLTLSGSNGYTGGTVLNAGTLAANSTASLPGYGTAGKVVFNGGTLQLPSAWAMADINTLVSNATKNSGALALDTTSGSQTQTAAWNLGALGLTKVGTGTLVLNQANTYSGATTVSAGTLQLSHANALGSSPALNVNAGAVVLDTTVNLNTLTFNGSAATVSGGTLNFAPGGSITNTVVAGHTISSGISGSPAVNIMDNSDAGITFAPTSASQTLGTLTVPYEAGSSDKGFIILDGTTTGNSVSKIQFASGNQYASVTKQGTGTWTVGNVDIGTFNLNAGNLVVNGTINTYHLGLNLNGGIFHYNNAAAFGTSANINFNGASLDNSSGLAITTSANNRPFALKANLTFLGSNGANSDLNLGTGAVTLSNSVLTGNPTVTVQNAATTLTVGGAIGGADIGLTKAGSGTLRLTGANTYSGPTAVTAGTLTVGNNLALQNSALNTTGAGVLTFTGTTPSIGGLNGSVDLATKFTTGYSSVTTLTLNPQTGITASYSGAIANGAMNLTKTGAGTQILSGTNTYGGNTTVTLGTLVANSTSALPGYNSAGKVVLNGGTLQVPVDGVAWTMANVDTLLSNATKTSGTLGLDIASGTQTQSGAYNMGSVGLTKVGAGTLGLNQANTYSGATAINGGTLLLNGANGAIASSSGIAVGTSSGTTGTLTLDSATDNNINRVGSVGVTMNNGTLNLIGNATTATTETIGTVTAAVGHNQLVLSGGDPSQIATLTSSAGAVTRTAGATLNILAGGASQQFKFTGGSAGVNKGVFYGATAATANEFAYYPGGGAAVVAPTYDGSGNFATPATTLTASKHNKLSGTDASEGAISIFSLNMPSNYSLTALTGNLTFSNAADQGAIIKSGGGAAQIGTAGNAFDIVGQTGGELVVNTVDTADNLTLNVGITATTTALTKTGAGTLTLTANRDYLYTGATNVNAGTLVLNSLTSAAAGGFRSNVTINNGGTVKLGAANKIIDTAVFTVNNGGTFDLAGFSETISSLAGNGSVGNTGGAATLTLNAATTFPGVISGNTALTLSGPYAGGIPTHVLSGSNTYTGLTTLNGANLRLGANNAINPGNAFTITTSNGNGYGSFQTFDLAGYDQTLGALTLGGGWGGGATYVFNSVGSSKLTLTGGLTYATSQSPDIWISVTTLDLNNATQTFNIPDSGVVTEVTVSSVIQNGALTKTNTGTMLVSGTNTYAGATTVSGGILSLGNALALQNSPLDTQASVTGGASAGLRTTATTLTLGGLTGNKNLASVFTTTSGGYSSVTALTLNPVSNVSYAGVIADGAASMTLTKTGAGTQTLTNTQTYTGATNVNNGILTLGHASNTLADTGAVNVNGGTLDLGANSDTVGSVTLASGSITGSGTLTAATYSLTGGTLAAKLGTGAVTVNGNVTFSAADRLNASSSLLIAGGTLTLAGNQSVNSFQQTGGTLAGGFSINSSSNFDLQSGTLSGNLGGSSGLTKTGVGTTTLSGTNTYTGATTINAGKLLVHGSTAAESNFTVNSGATLGGSGTINGTVTLMSGAFLSPGASIESLGLGSSTWNGGSTVQVEFSTDGSTGVAGTEWDQINITGILDLSGASSSIPIILDLVSMLNATTAGALGSWNEDQNATWAGFVTTTGGITGFAANKFTFDVADFQNTLNGTFNVSQVGNNLNLNYVIPEPKTVLLGVLGLLLLLRRRR